MRILVHPQRRRTVTYASDGIDRAKNSHFELLRLSLGRVRSKFTKIAPLSLYDIGFNTRWLALADMIFTNHERRTYK
ncbi:hypothetical protein HS088_TW12G00222 [Tripterygium wilfordii]|uniref:Uncharacterized protein n=1 Tax=Tripterygium wilfordii TaxID=458696 RepID=A0A7J7CY50_TRIWF|nr:hypothetical protein HS088_TW12G00222 [Tripterygium wilfordii]